MELFVGVVLYRNAYEELARLVRSLEVARTTRGTPPFEVLWLDNSPEAECRPHLERLLPGARYQASPSNLGFGSAHNRLMREAFRSRDARFYVCLNPDAVLHPNCLRELTAVASKGPRAGLVEARLFPEEHGKPYDPVSYETPWCTGCVLLVTRPLFDATGGFDEQIFMYCEDVDLSWRARASGFSTRVAPAALAHHYVEERPLSTARELQVRRSAAYLGRKYGNRRFEQRWWEEYLALGGAPTPLPRPPKLPKGAAALADFRHLLKFSEVRW